MLVITRKKAEKVIIGDNIEITILEVGRRRVRIGIKAPKQIIIQSETRKTESAVEDQTKPGRVVEMRPRDVA